MSGSSKSWKECPAKVQVSESELPSSIPPQVGLTFNVWYNKWSQGQSGSTRYVNKYRLEPNLHSGITNGDKQNTKFFCLYFAKGMCCLGKKCSYKHHVPDKDDVLTLSVNTAVLDCFGREKFGDYRDDMGGVGSFRKQNKTLYIGGISGALNNVSFKSTQIESRLRFSFAKLGELERIRYIESKNCAFVTFRYHTNAEFAKEVMSNQTLLTKSDKKWDERAEGTGLLVKWANEDPDPVAQRRRETEENEEALNVMKSLINQHPKRKRDEDHTQQHGTETKTDPETTNTSIFSKSLLGSLKNRKITTNIETKASKKLETKLVDYASSSDEE